MRCKHCGATIERATGYGVNRPHGQVFYFASYPSRCPHEPTPASADTTVAAAHRPAVVTYPTGSCGEYLSAQDADGGEQP